VHFVSYSLGTNQATQREKENEAVGCRTPFVDEKRKQAKKSHPRKSKQY